MRNQIQQALTAGEKGPMRLVSCLCSCTRRASVTLAVGDLAMHPLEILFGVYLAVLYANFAGCGFGDELQPTETFQILLRTN